MKQATRNYAYFAYTLPTEPVETYVTRALAVLREIKAQFPKFYKSFHCPSEVLTLSGARAFDTYYDLGEDTTSDEITRLKSLLKLHGIELLEETFAFGNIVYPDNRYSIVHIAALNDIPNRYKHMPAPGWNQPNFAKLEHDSDFFLWWATWQRDILNVPELDAECETWITHNSWMPHDVTFGMLLGYPGEAISSMLYKTEGGANNDQEVDATIAHADKFDGAHPTYSYLKEVAEEPTIIDHQKLWSAILDGVYSVLD